MPNPGYDATGVTNGPPPLPTDGFYSSNSEGHTTTAGSSGPLPPGFRGNKGEAYTREVQNNELASYQLNNLLNENGQYIQNARQNGLNVAANRGLLNSSMAAESSQKAAIESALPIATFDAGAYGNAAGQNIDALNTILASRISQSGALAGAHAQVASARIASEGALQRQRENLAFAGEQQGLDRAFTQMRDYIGYQFDLGRANNQYGNQLGLQNNDARNQMGLQNNQYENITRSNIQQYAARTGIDMRAQRVNFYNGLMNTAMENPDIWTPEAVGGFLSTYLPVYDEMSDWFDSQMFGGGFY